MIAGYLVNYFGLVNSRKMVTPDIPKNSRIFHAIRECTARFLLEFRSNKLRATFFLLRFSFSFPLLIDLSKRRVHVPYRTIVLDAPDR